MSIIVYCSVGKSGGLLRISGYITAESAIQDLQWPLPSEPFEVWACSMSDNAALMIRAEPNTEKAWKMVKTYSNYMQKCADVTGAS